LIPSDRRAVSGHLPVTGPIEPDDLGQNVRIHRIGLGPEIECRSRYRATEVGLIANTW
jgi:hypothetical protein